MDAYKNDYRRLRRLAKEFIIINAALSDELTMISEKIAGIETEKMHLLKELLTVNPKLRRELLSNQRLFGVERNKEGVKGAKSELKNKYKKIKKSKNSAMSTPEYLPSKHKKYQKTSSQLSSSSLQSPLNKGGSINKASLVPLDPTGRPIFPVKLENESLIVYSIGEIYPQATFHSCSSIFPVGFCSTRLYQSINPTGISSIEAFSVDTCLYTCKVSDYAGRPKFEIIAEDCTGITFVGTSPDDCCNKLRHTMSQFWDDQTDPIDGAWFFGLSHPTIKNFIQCMPGAKKCSNYQWVKYEIVKKTASAVGEETGMENGGGGTVDNCGLIKGGVEGNGMIEFVVGRGVEDGLCVDVGDVNEGGEVYCEDDGAGEETRLGDSYDHNMHFY